MSLLPRIRTKKGSNNSSSKRPSTRPEPPPSNPAITSEQSGQINNTNTPKKSYARATSPPSKNQIDTTKIIRLMKNFLEVIATTEDPKSIIISTINSFVQILMLNNE